MGNIFKKFPQKVIIWAVSGQIWSERRNFKKFSILEAIGHLLDRYEVERRKMIFSLFNLTNGTLLSLYGVKEEKLIFFIFNLANSYLLDRYGVEEER